MAKKTGTTYITTPGSVILHQADGTAKAYVYGDPVDRADLAEHQLENLDSFTGDDPGVKRDKPLAEILAESQAHDVPPAVRAAMADAGQPNSTSSPVPSNYGELDEEEATRFIRTLDQFPGEQARVLVHEKLNGNRSQVVQAATEQAQDIADDLTKSFKDVKNTAGPAVAVPGEAPPVEDHDFDIDSSDRGPFAPEAGPTVVEQQQGVPAGANEGDDDPDATSGN